MRRYIGVFLAGVPGLVGAAACGQGRVASDGDNLDAPSGADGGAAGPWQHGSTVVLSGSGFGTRPSFGRNGALVRAWDGCESDDPQAVWDEFGPQNDGAAPEYSLRCRTPAQVTAQKASGAAPEVAHTHASRYLTGAAFASTAYGADSFVTAYNTDVSPYLYASFYYRADPDWYQEASTDGNHKMYTYSAGNSPYAQAGYYYFELHEFADPLGPITVGTNYFTAPQLFSPCAAPQGDVRCVDPDLVNWYTQGCGGNGYNDPCGSFWTKYAHPRHPRRDWVKLEYVLKHGSSGDGVHDVYIDNVHTWHVELDDDALSPPPPRSETLGGYRRDYGTTDAYKNNWSYFSDVYLDLTWARVVVADSATYASATIVEPQRPLSWSDGQIEIRVNLGKLASGQTAWVYVFDASGAPVGGATLTSFVVP